MSYKWRIDRNEISSPAGGRRHLRKGISTAFSFDIYRDKDVFDVVVLSKPIPVSSKDAAAVLGGTSIASDANIDKIAFKGRVLGPHSMHLPLPDPCMLPYGTDATAVAKLILKHTTFISSTGYAGKLPSVGDIARVVLSPGDYSYNIQYAGFTKIKVFGDGTRQHKKFDVQCHTLRTKFDRFTEKDLEGVAVGEIVIRPGRANPCAGICPDGVEWQSGLSPQASTITTTQPLGTISSTSHLGPRMHPIEKICKCHYGNDYGCTSADDVYAIADGVLTVHETICVAGDLACGGGFGNWVSITHTAKTTGGESIITRYAHLTSVSHPAGPISKGAVIGKCGTTGRSTGEHLHLELRTGDGKTWDPATFISKYS